jgi:hypothetical protein
MEIPSTELSTDPNSELPAPNPYDAVKVKLYGPGAAENATGSPLTFRERTPTFPVRSQSGAVVVIV